jgi:hypothetical protein
VDSDNNNNKAAGTSMPIIRVSIFRSKSDPNTFAVSPDASGRVLPKPEEWEFVRSGTIEPAAARAGSETGKWLQAFEKEGYCLLKQDPVGGNVPASEFKTTSLNTK